VEHSETRGSIIGVDVGGTFTDLVMVDSASGTMRIAKTPTTLDNQAFGVLAALEQAEVDLGEVGLIVHGTTTTTNAVLERKLSRTGLITTAGFRDVLELGRRTRPQAYGMKGQFTPIIPRDLRLEVPERMDAQGNVLIPLDEDALRAAIRQLIDTGCEALVIHFLHAYANPAHELRAAEIAAETWPNSYITTGEAKIEHKKQADQRKKAAYLLRALEVSRCKRAVRKEPPDRTAGQREQCQHRQRHRRHTCRRVNFGRQQQDKSLLRHMRLRRSGQQGAQLDAYDDLTQSHGGTLATGNGI